ncbi:MAG: arylamine N-acetyltransferase [Sphingobium sp.]|nr:arylamine N-acetyltransferase [Sphingobium sp.]
MKTRLAAYLDRIGLDAAPALTLEGLATILAAHRRFIAFENLDVRLGRGIRIDSDSVFDKLVLKRRGGYCFEQNRLLADMLREIGFELRPLLARVRLGAPDIIPVRSHVTLLVALEGRLWIAEGGFGGSDLPALPLEDGAQAASPDGARHRLRKVGDAGALSGEWLLERAGPHSATDGRAQPHQDWQPQYSFDLAHVAPDDLEQCNHWTSTRPATRFTTLHIASIVLPDGFASMTDRALTLYRHGEKTERAIATPADYAATLRDVFRLEFSEIEAGALPLFALL